MANTESSVLALTRRARRRDCVPPDWREKRLRFALSLGPSWREAASLTNEDEVSFVPMDAVGEFGGLDLAATKPIGEIGAGYTFFADGDVVIAKITPCFENGKGALARNLRNGVAFGTTELHVLRAKPTDLLPEYLFYLSISQPFRAFGESSMYGAGGQKSVPEEFIKNARWPLPPLSEQRAIATFLERETARIDALIERKRRLIKLLQEKRVAAITQAVTRGLDHRVPLKSSGVAWLGDVPAHWIVKPLMALTPAGRPIMYGIVLPGPDVDEGVLIVKGGDVKPGRLRRDLLCQTTKEIEAGYARSRLRTGDLVFSIRGSVGEVELVPAEIEGANLTQDAARVAPRPSVDGKWLLYALKASAVVHRLCALSIGAAVRGINIRDLKRLRVPTPPRAEQEAIAAFLDARVERIDSMVEKVEAAILSLQEYRSALISAAVTGQIDVREAA